MSSSASSAAISGLARSPQVAETSELGNSVSFAATDDFDPTFLDAHSP
jgi:hypothetical protein